MLYVVEARLKKKTNMKDVKLKTNFKVISN